MLDDVTRLVSQQEQKRVLLTKYQDMVRREKDPHRILRIQREIEEISLIILGLEQQIKAFEVEECIDSIDAGMLDLNHQKDLASRVSAVENAVRELLDINRRAAQREQTTLQAVFRPHMYVLRPTVRMVDANLAYKYADSQSDLNILVGLTTLFLGTAVSAATSLGIATLGSSSGNVIAIHGPILAVTTVVTATFGFLARRAHSRALIARQELDMDAEADLSLAQTPHSLVSSEEV